MLTLILAEPMFTPTDHESSRENQSVFRLGNATVSVQTTGVTVLPIFQQRALPSELRCPRLAHIDAIEEAHPDSSYYPVPFKMKFTALDVANLVVDTGNLALAVLSI